MPKKAKILKDKPANLPIIIVPQRGPVSVGTSKTTEKATGSKETPAKPATTLKLTIDTLRDALHKGSLPSALWELKKYIDPFKAYDDGFKCGKKDVDTRSVEFNSNTEVMCQRMEAAMQSAEASLSALMDTAIYADQHDTLGGLKDTITETGFMWGVVTALKELIAQTEKAMSEHPGDQPTVLDEPEDAAVKYFENQKKIYAAKYGEMTWNRTMISDSNIEIAKAKSDYQVRFWTKVHQLALGIKPEVDHDTQDRKSKKENFTALSAWWLLLPVGIAGVTIGVRYFMF